MHELKTGLNADKFATFGCFPKVYNQPNTSRLVQSWKTCKSGSKRFKMEGVPTKILGQATFGVTSDTAIWSESYLNGWMQSTSCGLEMSNFVTCYAWRAWRQHTGPFVISYIYKRFAHCHQAFGGSPICWWRSALLLCLKPSWSGVRPKCRLVFYWYLVKWG